MSPSGRAATFRAPWRRRLIAGDIVQAGAAIDPVGEDVFSVEPPLVRALGAIVAIGFFAGEWEPLDAALPVGRNIGLHGFYRARLAKFRPDLIAEGVESVVRLWEDGEIRPCVGAEFPLYSPAHRWSKSGGTSARWSSSSCAPRSPMALQRRPQEQAYSPVTETVAEETMFPPRGPWFQRPNHLGNLSVPLGFPPAHRPEAGL